MNLKFQNIDELIVNYEDIINNYDSITERYNPYIDEITGEKLISDDTLTAFNIKLLSNGGFLAYPHYENNEIVALFLKSLDPDSEIKYSYTSHIYEQNEFLFGKYKEPNEKNYIIIVEGIFANLYFFQKGYNVASINGVNLSQKQADLINAYDNIYLFPDDDFAGHFFIDNKKFLLDENKIKAIDYIDNDVDILDEMIEKYLVGVE